MRTAGPLIADTPNTDLQLFVPATQSIGFNPSTGVGAFPTATAGVEAITTPSALYLDAIAIAASSTVSLRFDLAQLFVRTGILQSNNFSTNTSQEAFGTANGPGPNATPGTSDPSGMGYGGIADADGTELTGSNTVAPVNTKLLPTLLGPFTNSASGLVVANIKGVRVKWIDLIYQVLGVGLTSLALQLEGYIANLGHDGFIDLLDVYNVNTLTGAALAINSSPEKIHRERCTIQDANGNFTTQFLFNDGTMLSAIITAVTPSGSTAKVVGIILGCDYNLN
ncbi:MAG TPA: hypothetical protein VGF75_01465 [Candidatus Saccharimonadales bacterium]|jgi:hypothetical protein